VITLNVYRLRNDFEMPTYGTSLSNCFDLSFQPSNVIRGFTKENKSFERFVDINYSIEINPGDRILIPTGLVCKIEKRVTIETFADISRTQLPLQNYSIRLHPRSGLSFKQGLVLANSEGIVDVDYQQEIFVLLTNISAVSQTIRRGDRIAQAEIVCNEPFEFVVLTAPPSKHSERDGGFGSTGVAS